jgi:hypothetical protein
LDLALLDRQGQGPLPTIELGITNIGSGAARKIEINVIFQCDALREMIERSDVFGNIANVITDDEVTLLSEKFAQDMNGPGIKRNEAKLRYSVEGHEVVRILDPTNSDVQEWQIKVKLPKPVCRAILLYCVSSFVTIMKENIGSIGERIEPSYRGSKRDLDTPLPPDDWSKYKHVLPSLIIGLRYADDFGTTYQNTFEMPGAFVCMPNLVVGKPPRRRVLIRFWFSRAREIRP